MNKRKSIVNKRSKKTAILLSLMFLPLISTKAWGYAQEELSPSSSNDSFSEELSSSGDTFSSGNTFSFSRAVLTDKNGQAICQVNLEENPEFLPQFAELGSSDRLEPLDLPECEQQNLDIVAQYAQQAWVKKEVTLAPVVVAIGAFAGGCIVGSIAWITIYSVSNTDNKPTDSRVLPTSVGGIYGALVIPLLKNPGFSGFMGSIGFGASGGLFCSSITAYMFYE